MSAIYASLVSMARLDTDSVDATAIAVAVAMTVALLITYRLAQFLLITPLHQQYQLSAQGIPGFWFPIFGEIPFILYAMSRDQLFSYHTSMFHRYNSSSYHSSFGPFARLVTADPLVCKAILSTNAKNFEKSALMKLTLGNLLGFRNLILSEGQLHTLHRKAISPALHYGNLQSMQSQITGIVQNHLDKWTAAIHDSSSSSSSSKVIVLDVHEEFGGIALDIVSSSVFGSSSNNSDEQHKIIYNLIATALETFMQRTFTTVGFMPFICDLPLPSYKRLAHCKKTMRAIVMGIIADRKSGKTAASTAGADLLDLLLSAKLSSSDDNTTATTAAFTDQEVYEHALTFVVAGHETTGNLMTWCFHVRVQHPEVMAQLRREIDSVLGVYVKPAAATATTTATPAAALTYTQLASLPYCEAVLMETLRLCGPVPNLQRQATADTVVTDSQNKTFTIKKGCAVMLNLHRLHNDPAHWPEPDHFDPSRWFDATAPAHSAQATANDKLSSSNANGADVLDIGASHSDNSNSNSSSSSSSGGSSKRRRIMPYTFLAFSAGPRSCIGQQFALQEAKVMLSMIVRSFDFELVAGQRLVPAIAVTVRLKHGLKLKITERQQ